MRPNSFLQTPRYLNLLFALIVCGCQQQYQQKPPYVIIQQPTDIREIDNLQEVIPILYDNEINFNELSVEEKKEKFIAVLLPSVLTVKYNIDLEFNQANRILYKLHRSGQVDHADSIYMDSLQVYFNSGSWWDVRRRLKTHPTSIVLAQAAVESGWGSSRFFREANNLFGIWSFDPAEPRIESLSARGERSIYLRSYRNVAASIEDYFGVISRSNAYRRFRRERTRTNNPHRLIRLLTNYSELRGRYVKKLDDLISQNNLGRYDSARLAPGFTNPEGRISY